MSLISPPPPPPPLSLNFTNITTLIRAEILRVYKGEKERDSFLGQSSTCELRELMHFKDIRSNVQVLLGLCEGLKINFGNIKDQLTSDIDKMTLRELCEVNREYPGRSGW